MQFQISILAILTFGLNFTVLAAGDCSTIASSHASMLIHSPDARSPYLESCKSTITNHRGIGKVLNGMNPGIKQALDTCLNEDQDISHAVTMYFSTQNKEAGRSSLMGGLSDGSSGAGTATQLSAQKLISCNDAYTHLKTVCASPLQITQRNQWKGATAAKDLRKLKNLCDVESGAIPKAIATKLKQSKDNLYSFGINYNEFTNSIAQIQRANTQVAQPTPLKPQTTGWNQTDFSRVPSNERVVNTPSGSINCSRDDDMISLPACAEHNGRGPALMEMNSEDFCNEISRKRNVPSAPSIKYRYMNECL
ncbi:MAG: hypothetical protein HOO06_12165 [Bdellovibrionaceae bacterium]|jgi:hypothetical protein|nr:hypothetical protein [Pseudobdellovibrionaceae bacterium]